MDIKNEIVRAMNSPKYIRKFDGRTALELMVQSERSFQKKGRIRVNRTQYPLRCWGSRCRLDTIREQITKDTELLISGNLDQHYFKDSIPTTIIVVNDMANLRILDRGAAS